MDTTHLSLHEALQAEFGPYVDSSLITIFLAELEMDDGGNQVQPSPEQIATLRATLKELATQADAHDRERGGNEDDDDDWRSDSLLSREKTTASSSAGTTNSTSLSWDSSLTGSASSSSHAEISMDTAADFLRAALPHIPTETISQVLEAHGYGSDVQLDLDLEGVVQHLLTLEYVRELQERGLDEDQSKGTLYEPDAGPSWQKVGGRGKFKGKAKAGQRSKRVEGATIALGALPTPPRTQYTKERQTTTSTSQAVPDPWTRLTSIATHLSALLPPHPPVLFLSYFHSPEWESTFDALVACLNTISSDSTGIPPQPSSASPQLTSTESGREEIDESTAELLAMTSAPLHLVVLAMRAAQQRADDSLSLIELLQELHLECQQKLRSGDSRPTVAAAATEPRSERGKPALAVLSPSLTMPPHGRGSSSSGPGEWRSVPSQRSTAVSFAPSRTSLSTDPHTRIRERLRARRELLQNAFKAMKDSRKHGKRFRGDVAAAYAQQARKLIDMNKAEELELAMRMVERKRRASHDKRTLDLHGTTVSEAITIVMRILEDEGASAQDPLRIITGRGNHSAGGVSRLKPAVTDALVADGWDVGVWDAGLIVLGQRA